MNDYERKLHELVLNWKLRLVASALLSMLGLALMIATLSGFFVDMTLPDQTIVGVAVFIVMIPIYLIIADLPKIDEYTIASMLNDLVPEFNQSAELVLKSESELSENEIEKRKKIEPLYQNEKLYRYLPNRPITQGFILMLFCVGLTAAVYFLFI